jgi:hypothetical protein
MTHDTIITFCTTAFEFGAPSFKRSLFLLTASKSSVATTTTAAELLKPADRKPDLVNHCSTVRGTSCTCRTRLSRKKSCGYEVGEATQRYILHNSIGTFRTNPTLPSFKYYIARGLASCEDARPILWLILVSVLVGLWSDRRRGS